MFEKEFEFRGYHSKYVSELKGEGRFQYPVFNSFVEILMIAPILGVVYHRKSEVDKTSNEKSTIFLEQLLNRKSDLAFTSQLVLLSAYKDIPIEERAKRVFSPTAEQIEENDKLLLSFILGGVEILFENIFMEVSEFEDVVNNYYQFFSTYNMQYIQDKMISLELFESII